MLTYPARKGVVRKLNAMALGTPDRTAAMATINEVMNYIIWGWLSHGPILGGKQRKFDVPRATTRRQQRVPLVAH
jgi:hypothetical protein